MLRVYNPSVTASPCHPPLHKGGFQGTDPQPIPLSFATSLGEAEARADEDIGPYTGSAKAGGAFYGQTMPAPTHSARRPGLQRTSQRLPYNERQRRKGDGVSL